MTDADLRKEIEKILTAEIRFSAQVNGYVIHGAIDSIIKLIKKEVDLAKSKKS